MACVDNFFQPGPYDAMAIRRTSIQRMSITSPMSRTMKDFNLVNYRIYDNQPRSPQSKQSMRSSFVKRCSQIATGRRPSIQSTSSATVQPPPTVQWVQRLPSSPSRYESFLESALEEAVGQLVCGPNAAAEEFELAYNYDNLEAAIPEAWARVQAQRLEAQGKHWISASIQSKSGPNERAQVYAYGRWALVKTKKQY